MSAAGTADAGWAGGRTTRGRVPRRELILSAAAELFRLHGYHGVGIDEIGAAAGISGPAVYRHFGSKEDILLAIVTRAKDQLTAGTARALALARDAEEAVRMLVDSYVDTSLVWRDDFYVYTREGSALPGDQERQLQRDLRAVADEWAHAVAGARPGLPMVEARVMVSGAMSLMSAAVQSMPEDLAPAEAMPLVAEMGLLALLGRS